MKKQIKHLLPMLSVALFLIGYWLTKGNSLDLTVKYFGDLLPKIGGAIIGLYALILIEPTFPNYLGKKGVSGNRQITIYCLGFLFLIIVFCITTFINI